MNDSSSKYLTLETFGFKLNVNGVSLKKKQMWTLEQDEGSQICYFRSHLNRYLSADPKGNVKCEDEERGEETKFTVETQSSGKWAIKSVYGAYFGGVNDQLKCIAKPTGTELWCIQLAMHPQVNLKSSRRTRFVHLNTKTDTLDATEIIPWGADAMITLEFDESQGKYAIVASDGKYLSNDGSLHEDTSKKSLFTIEFHEGELAFRTDKGTYLTAVGTGKIQAGKNTTVGKDELFTMQDSPPQVSFIGPKAGRRLSIHQGKLHYFEQGLLCLILISFVVPLRIYFKSFSRESYYEIHVDSFIKMLIYSCLRTNQWVRRCFVFAIFVV